MFQALRRSPFLTITIIFTATGGILGGQAEEVRNFNLAGSAAVASAAAFEPPSGATGQPDGRLPVGSVTSAEAGIGIGVSVARTYDDAQNVIGWGRHISHFWNREYGSATSAGVHFSYRAEPNQVPNGPGWTSGYNVYDATGGGDWPLLQDVGCTLQGADTAGFGMMPSLAVMDNGRVVMASGWSHLGNGFLGDGSAVRDNMLFYQDAFCGCYYTYGTNAVSIDSLSYRARFISPANGVYARDPIVETQWDGDNTIVHLLLDEGASTQLVGNAYSSDLYYRAAVYFRKVGMDATAGAWSAGQVIDSVWFPWLSMSAAPFPHAGVAVTYTNPSYFGALLNEGHDLDVWCRESPDRGLSWGTAHNITNYTNAIPNDPNHFTAWLETQCLYTSNGDLQVIWTADETSPDPYFDGYDWEYWFEDIYHWSKSVGTIRKVASGTYDDLQDGMWDYCDFGVQACGFGGNNARTIANINISECDNQLYCIWNQIHERASDGWCSPTRPPYNGRVDDCAYTDNPKAIANWEIMMSTTELNNTSLWDAARNLSDTYTPGCGLPGDPDADGLCGDEYKPTVEKYGLNETGLNLTWPMDAVCDLTPSSVPAYSGGYYLNMQYLDDIFPGPSVWSWTTEPRTLNSIKWVRLACVEPVYAPQIEMPREDRVWPQWLEQGQEYRITIPVVNTGNAILHVTNIDVDDFGEGRFDVSETSFEVQCWPNNTAAFDVIIDATGLTEPTWLSALATVESDAANRPSYTIMFYLLAADYVEEVKRDTVVTDVNMFDPFFAPQGECVALSVSNHGEMGLDESRMGRVNLDYVESGLECGTRNADAHYLKSGSAFVIVADDASGSNALVTSSFGLVDQAAVYSWDPVFALGGMTSGTHVSPHDVQYYSTYTGRIVNRDTTIAIERTYYAPLSSDPVNEVNNFVVALTKVYSADGNAHGHVTVGDIYDWNVPSDSVGRNNSSIGKYDMLYFVGTDTMSSTACQSNEQRYAVAVFGGGWDGSQGMTDVCLMNETKDYYACSALPQHLMKDTTHYRNGTPLEPAQPNPEVWWEETSVPGVNAAPPELQNTDQGVWLTYRHDHSLGAQDTLVYWVILTTVRAGTLTDLENQVQYAGNWFGREVLGCEEEDCCHGLVGDANGSGTEVPTIGDISALIDAKFISSQPCGEILPCIAEADVNQSGGCNPTCDDVTIGDISRLIDLLFISQCLESQPLEECLMECLLCNSQGWWH